MKPPFRAILAFVVVAVATPAQSVWDPNAIVPPTHALPPALVFPYSFEAEDYGCGRLGNELRWLERDQLRNSLEGDEFGQRELRQVLAERGFDSASIEAWLSPAVLGISYDLRVSGSNAPRLSGTRVVSAGALFVLGEREERLVLSGYEPEIAQGSSITQPEVSTCITGEWIALWIEPTSDGRWRAEWLARALDRDDSRFGESVDTGLDGVEAISRCGVRFQDAGGVSLLAPSEPLHVEWGGGHSMSLDLKVDRAAPVPPAGLYRVPILERAAPGFSAMPKMPAWEPSYGAIIAPDWFWQATNAKEESAGDYLGIGVVQDSALEYFGGGLVARLDDEDVAANQRVIDTLLALEKQQVCSRDVGIDIVSVDGAGAESLEGQLHCRMIAESLHAFGAGLGLLSLVHWDTDVANGARIGDPGAAPLAEGVYGTVALRVDSDLKPTSVDLMVCIDRIVGIESEKVRLGRPIGPQGLEVISNARRDRPEDEIATEDVTFPAQPEIVVPIEFPDVVRWSMATSIPLDEHGVGKASQSATRLRGPGSSIDLRVTVR